MKLDRLLSRIRSALQDYASEFEQRALAAEYTECCTKAAQRLEQIVPLIREGQNFPALQIAESPPPVLDLVRQLSFAEAEQWRAFCRQRGLPTPQPFDERNVDLVNQLYGKKISETHPLYREYRQAIRTRHEEQALHVLQSIRRVNPDDANAHTEFARLARNLFERRRTELNAALDQHDALRALGIMDAVEADNLPGRDQDAIWQRAQSFREQHQLNTARERCLALAALLQEARANNDWNEALPLLAEWDTLRGQYAISLPPDIEEGAAGIREWAAVLLAGREREDERLLVWRRLTNQLDKLSGENPKKKPSKILAAELDELTTELSVLETQASASDGGSAPPPDLVRRLDQEASVLRRHLRSRQMAFAGVVAAVIIATIATAAATIWMRARQEHLNTSVASIRQYLKDGATGSLDQALKNFDAHYANLTPDSDVATLLTQARDFVQTHQVAYDSFNKQLAQITQAAQNPSASQIAELLANLDELDKQTGTLGTEDANPAKASIQTLRVRLNQELTHEQDERVAKLTDISSRINKLIAEKLTGAIPADAVLPVVLDAQKILAESEQLPPAPDSALPAEKSARAQLDALAKKLSALATAATSATENRTQLEQAHALAEYRAALESLGANILQNDPTVSAAHALAEKNPDWANAAQRILLPGEPETWTFLQQAGGARLQPAVNEQGDDIAYSTRLVNNDVLDNTYRADLVEYAAGVEVKRTPVFLSGPPAGNHDPGRYGNFEELIQTAKIINQDGTTQTHSARWVHFDGDKPKGEKFENVELAPESKLVSRLKQAYDPRAGSIREPLLRVLDDVRANDEVSPIFKAYVEQEIFKIIQNHPRDWGLAFSPTAQAESLALAKITGGSLQPTDWLFPARSSLTDDLQAFYQHANQASFYNEAEQNLQALLKKFATPVRFAGYVDLQQAPRLANSTSPNTTLWGFDTTGNWHALYEIHSGQVARPADSPTPALLTPLVYAQENAGNGT